MISQCSELFQNGLENKNANTREKQWDKIQVLAYKACDRMCMPLCMPETLETCKKACLVWLKNFD